MSINDLRAYIYVYIWERDVTLIEYSIKVSVENYMLKIEDLQHTFARCIDSLLS